MDDVLFGRVVDADLDAHGREQAESLAHRLSARLEDPIIEASPRRRTQQTAAIIASSFGRKVSIADDLDEIDFGRWSARTFKELDTDREWRSWNEHRSEARTPAGVTIAQVQDRAMRYLSTLAERYPSRFIAVVTHSEIIRSILMRCLDVSADYYDRIAIDPASVTTIQMGERRVRVVAVNERLMS